MYNNKPAFTLAEVLITLGIIGVVAAMTMPVLIQNHQKTVTVTSLKKFYSILSQAYSASVADNGLMREWDTSLFENGNKELSKKLFDKYFSPYLKVMDECKSIDQCTLFTHTNINKIPVYILADGMTFSFSPAYNNDLVGPYIYIIVDINGNKGPNKTGRDIFFLDIYADKGVAFLGTYHEDDVNEPYSRDEIKNGHLINDGEHTSCCATECPTPVYTYHNCGALIQADGWQIKEDYPW